MRLSARLLVALLITALAVSNAIWASLYLVKLHEYSVLQSEYRDLSRDFELLAKRAAKLEDNNTALILRVRDLEERLRRLASFIEDANETLRRALLVTRVLKLLNQSIWRVYEYTYTHAYFTPDARRFVNPATAGDLLVEVIGTTVYDPRRCWEHLRALYNYTAREIATSPDQPFIALRNVKLVEIGGKKFIYSFEAVKTNNYIQSVAETLDRRAGDCEDKAILLTSLYKAYLGPFGDAWVFCIFGKEGYNHCVTVAYVKPYGRFVLADPTLEFYTVAGDPRDAVDKLFSYIGLRWSDVEKAVLFNNIVYKDGTIYDIIDYLRSFARG